MKLRFDFLDYPYSFDNPLAIIQTNQLSDVISCIETIERWVQKGYYAAGFISYEAAPAFRSYLKTHPPAFIPLLWFGIFTKPHKNEAIPENIQLKTPFLSWRPDCSWQEYQQAIVAIKKYIAEGDSYQINYTLRMQTDFNLDPYAFYLHLLQAQQSNYSAYLDIGNTQILSASPELFFQIKDRQIIARPMKGTAPRGLTLDEDQINASKLDNEKNRAENLMIVDLLRNDIGQIAQQGTVKVTSLFKKEKYPTVWQLTSEIRARLQHHVSLLDVFTALYPCGSITGAPKASTMDIIRQLEKQPRGIYCGALGILTPQQEAIFSVPIRTLVVNHHKAVYGVGGGITWDSTPHDEYDEVIHKIQVLYDRKIPQYLLESLLLEEGRFFLLDLHLQRLQQSAEYFGFTFDLSQLKQQLSELADDHCRGLWKIRLLLNVQGQFQLMAQTIRPVPRCLTATWSEHPMQSQNVFLYHKTAQRDFYPQADLAHEYLLYNEKGEVTEFVNGNIVLYKKGQWVTPPIQSGVLNGTMRQYLLQQGIISEQIIRKEDIKQGCEIAFINSVRKWRKIIWQDSIDFPGN